MRSPATAKETLDYARSFEGYTESPPGSNMNQFGARYGMNGVPYCVQFVWDICTHCFVPILKTAYSPTLAQWFVDQKRGFTDESKIEKGDILFFDFPDSLRRIQHVGFALGKLIGGRVSTIEANTSSSDAGSQDNGGGVFVRSRGTAEIVYIGRPAYSEHVKVPRFDLPKSKTWFGKGDSGADVLTWQRDLNRWMAYRRKHFPTLPFDWGKIAETGTFNDETVMATKTFQKQYTILDVDGRVGRGTERKMQAVRERQREAA